MADTRQRLLDGAMETIRRQGIGGASARAIAATAGVNQALVFYHFGSVGDLIAAACRSGTEARIAPFLTRLHEVASLRELLALGRQLHAEERELGNVTVLSQVLAGAQTDPQLAEAASAALHLWIGPIERTLERLLDGSPLAEVTDVPGLARAVSAGFIGLELYEGIDPGGAAAALHALEQLAALAEVMDDLGPVARRALRARLRKSAAAR
ncbi:TetR/AcrR family transcriptional regulator [Streptomyces litchfieldiae]|uniref:TetR/AcrR family transcriptional regulator n=1 Tax=Streptomyces litchfieldiae TaxID=3075543 RepID=A0ABU2MWC1_9ACTN|nr:TetR/AcrR family transcriptional regulator [Streptomyces sp. DSM 44938]MDT0345904.1 TetR/AcrR family transcriptional regulator [Streptomyces sp. DSM 44938]